MKSPLRLMRIACLCLLASLSVACAAEQREEGAADWIELSAADSAAALSAASPSVAAGRLTALIERPVPSSVAAEDARVLRQDAYDRLAQVALSAGDHQRAKHLAERGLNLGGEMDIFRANLLISRGRAREMSGDDPGAAADYESATAILELALGEILGDTQ